MYQVYSGPTIQVCLLTFTGLDTQPWATMELLGERFTMPHLWEGIARGGPQNTAVPCRLSFTRTAQPRPTAARLVHGREGGALMALHGGGRDPHNVAQGSTQMCHCSIALAPRQAP